MTARNVGNYAELHLSNGNEKPPERRLSEAAGQGLEP